MAQYESEPIKLRVRKGMQIEVEEVDELRDDDDRVRDDRDALLELPVDLKVAVKRVSPQAESGVRAVVTTMCG